MFAHSHSHSHSHAEYAHHHIVNLLDGAIVTENIRQVLRG